MKRIRKLALHKETLQQLDPAFLVRIGGEVANVSNGIKLCYSVTYFCCVSRHSICGC